MHGGATIQPQQTIGATGRLAGAIPGETNAAQINKQDARELPLEVKGQR